MRRLISRSSAAITTSNRVARSRPRGSAPFFAREAPATLVSFQRRHVWDLNLDERPSMFEGEKSSEPWERECNKAEAALDNGQLDDALKYAQEAVEISEHGEIRPLTLLAEIHTERGEYDEAIKVFDRVLLIWPKSVPTFISLSECYARKGDLEQAQRHIDLVVTHDPRNVDGRFTRAGIYLNQGKKDEALNDLLAITQEPVVNVDKALLVADQLFRLSAHDDAASYHKKIIQRDPKRWEGWYGLGISLFALGFHAEAIDRFSNALELSPNEPQALVSRALAYSKFKNFDKALEDASKALEFKPTDTHALLLRIHINFSRKRWGEVINDAETVERELQTIVDGQLENSSLVDLASKQLSSVLIMQSQALMRLFLSERKDWTKKLEPLIDLPNEYTISEVIAEFGEVHKLIKRANDKDLERIFLILVRARKIDPVSFHVVVPLLWLKDIVQYLVNSDR